MTGKRFRTATLDEVLIRCSEDTAWVIFKDRPFEDQYSLTIGPEIALLTDEQVLDRVNAHYTWVQANIDNERPREIAEGFSQLEWNELCEVWSPVGDVLRCHVASHKEPGARRGKLAIRIDDKLLSAKEFTKLLETHEGWGMRIEFMNLQNLARRPKPIIGKRKTERKKLPYPKF